MQRSDESMKLYSFLVQRHNSSNISERFLEKSLNLLMNSVILDMGYPNIIKYVSIHSKNLHF